MASFFQFPDQQPSSDDSGPWLLLSNHPVPVENLLNTPAQVATLAIGAAALVIGFAFAILPAITKNAREKLRNRWSSLSTTLGRPPTPASTDGPSSEKSLKHRRSKSSFYGVYSDHTHSFSNVAKFQVDTFRTSNQTLRAGTPDTFHGRPVDSVVHFSISYGEKQTKHLSLSSVDLAYFSSLPTADKRASTLDALILSDSTVSSGFHGVVLCHFEGSTVEQALENLENLRDRRIPVILKVDADSTLLDHVDLSLLDGLLLENACIWPDGTRRDFFRSTRVRTSAARCKQQRESRPNFFFGFVEVWAEPPSAAVLRRAFKLGDFLGAAVDAHPEVESGMDGGRKSVVVPLSGFDWLKRPEVVRAQAAWSKKSIFALDGDAASRQGHFSVRPLLDMLPGAGRLLLTRPVTPKSPHRHGANSSQSLNLLEGAPRRYDIWNYASCNTGLSPRGFYGLLDEVTEFQYSSIVAVQRDLRKHRLLRPYKDAEMNRIVEALEFLRPHTAYPELLAKLCKGLKSETIRLLAGLDSGFSLPDEKGHFWAVTDTQSGKDTVELDIYISQKAHSEVTAVWHAYLAQHGVPRLHRFEEELFLSSKSESGITDESLPKSIRVELHNSSEAELLYLIQQITVSTSTHPFCQRIIKLAEQILIRDTTRTSWNKRHSRACLEGSESLENLLKARLAWFKDAGTLALPTLDGLARLSSAMEQEIKGALSRSDKDSLKKLTEPILAAYDAPDSHAVAPAADLYALIFFYLLRRAAFENVFLDTTDRCPYFLSQPDQAAVFAELWVLGSQCAIYFGLPPRALGEIIFTQYRQHLIEQPPPDDAWDGKNEMNAFFIPPLNEQTLKPGIAAGSGSGLVPKSHLTVAVEDYKRTLGRMSAMSIFCFPAILDVALLAFVGRGLFVTAFMVSEVKTVANYAILTALIMTGGVTGFVGSSGGFYLHNDAFDNMVHFLVHRLSAAMMLSLAVALCGFLGFGLQISWFAGGMYILYLLPPSIFLTILAIFATMYRPDCPLPSGRTAMWKCLPILLISPIVTTFVRGWDLLIYLLVIWGFSFVLLLQFRSLCQSWANWIALVPRIKEKDIVAWYKETSEESSDVSERELPDVARNTLYRAIYEHGSLRFRCRQTLGLAHDKFVASAAKGLPLATFLLRKQTADGPLPEPFTNAWFVQLDLALGNQQHLKRGLKEHSGFIMYRHARYDIAQNIGLFLLALLDRLIEVAMSARTPSPAMAIGAQRRYVLCFALLHFLFGALSVDMTLSQYWNLVASLSKDKLSSCKDIRQCLAKDEQRHRKLYRTGLRQLGTLFATHLGILAVLLWLLVEQRESLALFFCYISSYTAVLLCQFNRCFTKSHRLHVCAVLACIAVGFLVGVILRAVPATATFTYDFVIGQNVAALSAAVITSILTFDRSSANATSRSESQASKGEDDKPVQITAADCGPSAGGSVCKKVHYINGQILRHLCGDIDINTQWAALPENVRRSLLERVMNRGPSNTTWPADCTDDGTGRMEAHDSALAQLCSGHESIPPKAGRDNARAEEPALSGVLTSDIPELRQLASWKHWCVDLVMRAIDSVIKWMALLTEGTPDAPRELWYTMRNVKIRWPLIWILLKIWKLCWWARTASVYVFIIAGKPDLHTTLKAISQGSRRTLRHDRIIVDSPELKMTGMFLRDAEGQLNVMAFEGVQKAALHSLRPVATASYDAKYRLTKRLLTEDPQKAPVEVAYEYDGAHSRWPVCRKITTEGTSLTDFYDNHGRPVSGWTLKGGAEYAFEYTYAHGKEDANVIAAIYRSVAGDGAFTMRLFWCDRPRDQTDDVKRWIPSEKIHAAEFEVNGTAFEVFWKYKHARDADIEASALNSKGKWEASVPPPWIFDDKQGWLRKPKGLGFDREDLLIHHSRSSLRSIGKRQPDSVSPMLNKTAPSGLAHLLGLDKRVVRARIPTSALRTNLWLAWGKAPFLDAPSACFLDEIILRKEPLLRRYWRLRDSGRLKQASMWLDEHLESILPAIEPSLEASSTCPLLIKPTDLFAMGGGKAANQLTGRPGDAYQDTDTTTSVIFSDNGCWPDNPGGVSNCRRDLVNGHTSIRGHCLAESANEYGIPRYQIERNINSLKVLPLWGMDHQTAHHGVFDNLLESQVDDKMTAAGDENITTIFIPLLVKFIHGARSRHHSRADLVEYSNVILQMNRYFENCDFTKTWRSPMVWKAWISAWLVDYKEPHVLNFADAFDLEKPSLNDFRDALNLFIAYFFIYSVDLPSQGDCPGVFQSTHHGVSSLFGMLLKYRRGTTWGLWDHAILWRETCLNISPAQCLLPLPVQSMLLAAIKLACNIAYTHTDIVLPCTSLFNPDWEASLAMDDGRRGSVKTVHRKIDPIVNGIGNMDGFAPVESVRSLLPTAVMLSNVQFIKDVKAAVYAADYIINVYGFKDYRLLIYGAQDRQPAYAMETAKLIVSKGLTGKVKLAGFGSPKEVLKDAWLFMNSSLSEGLPLAIGEAALSGVPIVATEVGATALVLTDPDEASKRYGEVVPPNDPEALARAQLSILAMMGPWAQYTASREPAELPNAFTPEDVARITQRMHDTGEDRRALGLKLREVVLRSFHGHRYLREHEQMYWVQRKRAELRRGDRNSDHNAALVELPSQAKAFVYKAERERQSAARQWLFGESERNGGGTPESRVVEV